MQGTILSPHLAPPLLNDVSQRWSQYINRCVSASAYEVVEALGSSIPFSLKPILANMEGGHYIGPILSVSLADLASGRRSAGRSAPNIGGSNDGGGETKKLSPKVAATGGTA